MIARALALACLPPVLLLSLVASAAAPAKNAAHAKEELRELKSRIDAVQRRLADAEESKSDALDQLKESDRAISKTNRELAELTERSRVANTRLAAIRQEQSATEAARTRQQESLARLLYQQYANGRPETLTIVLNGGDPNAIARELHYFTYIAKARSDMVERLRQALERLQALAREAETQAHELAEVTAEQVKHRKRLEQEKRSRAQVLVRVSREIDDRRREMATLKRDESRLTRLVEQLAKVLARKPAPRPRASVEPRGRSAPEPRVWNDRLPERSGDGVPFAQLRGKLALPVRGELGNRFGSPRDGGMTWKGLLISAKAGEEVRAIAPGRVVFADWLRGFGNLLIIDHGDNYMSLYGYNETLFRGVGDVIRGGDRIAAVGSTGGHQQSGLYFELRHEGRPVDPLSWVSVR